MFGYGEVLLRRMSHDEWDVWYRQQRQNYIEQMVTMGAVNLDLS